MKSTTHGLPESLYVEYYPLGATYVCLLYSPVWTCKHSLTGVLWFRAVVGTVNVKRCLLKQEQCVCGGLSAFRDDITDLRSEWSSCY